MQIFGKKINLKNEIKPKIGDPCQFRLKSLSGILEKIRTPTLLSGIFNRADLFTRFNFPFLLSELVGSVVRRFENRRQGRRSRLEVHRGGQPKSLGSVGGGFRQGKHT